LDIHPVLPFHLPSLPEYESETINVSAVVPSPELELKLKGLSNPTPIRSGNLETVLNFSSPPVSQVIKIY
jgi:hypothetical protein